MYRYTYFWIGSTYFITTENKNITRKKRLKAKLMLNIILSLVLYVPIDIFVIVGVCIYCYLMNSKIYLVIYIIIIKSVNDIQIYIHGNLIWHKKEWNECRNVIFINSTTCLLKIFLQWNSFTFFCDTLNLFKLEKGMKHFCFLWTCCIYTKVNRFYKLRIFVQKTL